MRIRPGGVGSSRHSGQTKIRSPISIGFRYSCANATQSRVSAGLISPPKRDSSSGCRASSSKNARRSAIVPVFQFHDARAAGFPELRDGEILVFLRAVEVD